MASSNRLLPVWGSHLGKTRGWERGTFFATGKQLIFKDFQFCLPTLPPYFPLKFPYGQFPPKIPGPVSQTKSKTKKNSQTNKKTAAELRKESIKKKHKLNQSIQYLILFN
jgi:hypothetical protein